MKIDLGIVPDQPSVNGIVYPKDVVDKAIDEYVKKYVMKGNAFGTNNFPEITNVDPYSVFETRLDKASFKIEDITKKENKYIADIYILDTPEGRILQDTLNDKNCLRMAGAGSLNGNEIGNDFKLINFSIGVKENGS